MVREGSWERGGKIVIAQRQGCVVEGTRQSGLTRRLRAWCNGWPLDGARGGRPGRRTTSRRRIAPAWTVRRSTRRCGQRWSAHKLQSTCPAASPRDSPPVARGMGNAEHGDRPQTVAAEPHVPPDVYTPPVMALHISADSSTEKLDSAAVRGRFGHTADVVLAKYARRKHQSQRSMRLPPRRAGDEVGWRCFFPF